MKTWIVLGLLALLVRPVLALQGLDCPNTRATSVPAHIVGIGATTSCQLGVVLFGVAIGLDAGKCPRQAFHFPAHDACLGEGNPGTYCGSGPAVAVTLQKCACAAVGSPELALTLPFCLCRDVGSAGTLTSGKTFDCVGD